MKGGRWNIWKGEQSGRLWWGGTGDGIDNWESELVKGDFALLYLVFGVKEVKWKAADGVFMPKKDMIEII